MFDACRKITHPAEGIYGIRFSKGRGESWHWVTFLWSAGGDVMSYDAAKDEWTATFDSDEAVTALDFYVRLTSEHWRDPLDGRDRYGYATKETDSSQKWDLGQIGFFPTYIDARLFATIDPDIVGMVPVPKGYPDKNGVRHRGGELNSRMQGIFAGKDWRLVGFVIVPTVRPDGGHFEPSPAVVVCGNVVFCFFRRVFSIRRSGL